MIAICIVTYNAELFIEQCIKSALEQSCEEPYKLYISDDYSQDNTIKICEHYKCLYPNKIELLYSHKNEGLVKNSIKVLKRIVEDECEFIAMLDGDDFWIDQYKLQKEFEFLINNQDYGLIHTNISQLWNSKF